MIPPYKVILVTGASSGIGKAMAKKLANEGHMVYCAARRLEKMSDLKDLGIPIIKMDLADEVSVVEAVKSVIRREGRLDVLINNAGQSLFGALEDVSICEARHQFEVNLFGGMRLSQLVIPYMRRKNYGKIINISSIDGKLAMPMGGWYSASKFALEGLSDTLRNEVKQFGIDVILIQPGGVKSELGPIAMSNMVKISGNGCYGQLAHKLARVNRSSDIKYSEPVIIADVVSKAISSENPKTRYIAGYMARPLLVLRSFLTDKLMDKVLMSRLK